MTSKNLNIADVKSAGTWILIGIGAFLLFRLVKGLKSVFSPFSATDQTVKEAKAAQDKMIDKEVAELEKKEIRQSYTDNQYAKWADALEQAMKGTGTDEKAIYNIFAYLKNDIDVLKLDKAFGFRKGSGGVFVKNENLTQWLYGDLNSTGILTINTIFKKRGINIRL